MRCHYLSDLHLENQEFPYALPKGEVLIVAGDVCHASCLSAERRDIYAVKQRDRVFRFADEARRNFSHVLLIAGNHDHYDGVFEDTVPVLRRCLPGITVLDDDAVEIGDVAFFGMTLWTDLEGRNPAVLDKIRRGVGEYFFVKTRRQDESGAEVLQKFRPGHSLAAFEKSLAALDRHLAAAGVKKTVVISHHAPSRLGGNPQFAGNGLDGAYFSDLDARVAAMTSVPVWVHGHTHICRSYRIGATAVHVNCRGFETRGGPTPGFKPDRFFEV